MKTLSRLLTFTLLIICIGLLYGISNQTNGIEAKINSLTGKQIQPPLEIYLLDEIHDSKKFCDSYVYWYDRNGVLTKSSIKPTNSDQQYVTLCRIVR